MYEELKELHFATAILYDRILILFECAEMAQMRGEDASAIWCTNEAIFTLIEKVAE